MNTSKTLRIAVAIALGIASEVAVSGIDLGTPATIAREENSGGSAVVKMSINIPTDKLQNRCVSKANTSVAASASASTTNPCITSSMPSWVDTKTVDAPLEIRFSLTGGATFSALPAVADFVCVQSRASAAGANSSGYITNAAAILQTTPSTLSFKVDSGTILGTCSATVTISLASGEKDYGLMVSAQHQYPVDVITFSTAGSIITFGQAFNAAITPTIVTIDVRDPSLSKKFVEGGTTQTVVKIGTLSYKLNGSSYYKRDATTNLLGAIVATDSSDYLTGTKLTLSGTPLIGGVEGVFTTLESNNCNEANKLGAGLVVPASGSVAIDISNSTDELTNANGVVVCYKANTTTPIEKGSITYKWEVVTAGAGKTPNLDIPGDKQLSSFTKNGASIKVLNIPSPTNAVDLPFIRVYNMGPTTANIYGTLYGQGDASNVGGGDILGGKSGVALLKLDPGAVGVIQAADIAKALGIDPLVGWVGRAWLQMEADSQLVRVQALIRSGGAGGTLVNASDRVTADSEAICRSSGCN